MIRGVMVECVETKFGVPRVPQPVDWLTESGSVYATANTVDISMALQLRLSNKSGRLRAVSKLVADANDSSVPLNGTFAAITHPAVSRAATQDLLRPKRRSVILAQSELTRASEVERGDQGGAQSHAQRERHVLCLPRNRRRKALQPLGMCRAVFDLVLSHNPCSRGEMTWPVVVRAPGL